MNSITNTFLEFLKVKYYLNFQNSIQEFLDNNTDLVLSHLNYANDVVETEIETLNFINVWIDDGPEDVIYFDVAIEFEFSATFIYGSHHDIMTEGLRLWVNVICNGDLSEKLSDFCIVGIEEYSKTKPKNPLLGDLVPIISKAEYGKHAEDILEKYYPEALKSTKPIDIEVLAQRMGLNIYYKKLSEEQQEQVPVLYYRLLNGMGIELLAETGLKLSLTNNFLLNKKKLCFVSY